MDFTPISLDDYIDRHVRSNPGASWKDLKKRLTHALAAHRRGEVCACGNPIWVIGSAQAGLACFTCITGEAWPEHDYEIDEAFGASSGKIE
jgi:hypothetical protein